MSMESGALPDTGSPESSSDFAFAFNDVNFSDRVLRIEILPDTTGSKPDPDDSLADWARNRKRRRDDQLSNADERAEQREEQILNCNMPDLEDGVAYENQDEEAVAMVEESPVGEETTINQSGHEAAQGSEASSSMDYSEVQVKTIHISSPILAAKSPFFYKLFSNGMRESAAATCDSTYPSLSNTLPRTTPTALLDVLMAADKFEVASCMRYCSRLLRNIPMTCESALLYLDLPSTILMADTVQPLTDAAKQFLAARFKDISKFQEEVLNLPLAGIEAVLFSDDLQVASEDAVYDFVLKWARMHYPKLEERREILSTRLLRFVRFPCMTCRKLKKVLTCSDIDPELASKVVLDALFFKAEAPYRQRSLVAEEANASFRRREECAQLFPAGRVYSQAFHLGGQGFFLSGHCNMDQQSSFHCFGLFLGMQEKGSVAFTVDYEFASRTKPSEDFVSKYKGNYTFTGGKAVGYRNLFGVPWTAFIADDSPYFINGILHLRAELTIKK
ncbi:UNVERIFIED_CONTAM: BTB/POZ domain-containing protein POB1 [Sesamum radiatum]|uniref:BTB/POZ domain-containing protein POB1 n=1 Tax=Sesamum radiatum TaxID=300843 RepID=A0AAW2TSY2_SESRA